MIRVFFFPLSAGLKLSLAWEQYQPLPPRPHPDIRGDLLRAGEANPRSQQAPRDSGQTVGRGCEHCGDTSQTCNFNTLGSVLY